MNIWFYIGIFIVVCFIVAFILSLRRNYKDDALKYTQPEIEVEHVLQQKLNIKKKSQPRRKKEPESNFPISNIIGVFVGLVVLVAIGIPILTNVTSIMAQYNTTSSSSTSIITNAFPILLLVGPILIIVSLYSVVDTK